MPISTVGSTPTDPLCRAAVVLILVGHILLPQHLDASVPNAALHTARLRSQPSRTSIPTGGGLLMRADGSNVGVFTDANPKAHLYSHLQGTISCSLKSITSASTPPCFSDSAALDSYIRNHVESS